MPTIVLRWWPSAISSRSLLSGMPGYTDLDMYLHVNNARYIDWVLNLFPEDMHRNFSISSFLIEFLSEVKYSEEIRLFASINPDESLVKGIRAGDGKTIFKAKVLWKKR